MNPSESVPGDSGQKSEKESANSNPDSEREQDQKDKGPSLKKKDFAIAFVEAVVGGSGFSLLGEYFDTIGFHDFKKWSMLLALIAVQFALAHLVFKAVSRKRIVWAILAVVSLLEFSGLTIVALKPDSQPAKPHFKLSFRFGDSKSGMVALTNNFLMVRDFGVPVVANGFLVLPTQLGQMEFLFNFVVENEPQSTISKMAYVVASVPKQWKCVPEHGWTAFENNTKSILLRISGVNVTNEMQSWTYALRPMFPGNGEYLPPIRVTSIPSAADFDILLIMVRDENAAPTAWAWQTAFVPTNATSISIGSNFLRVTKPLVVLGTTNSAGDSVVTLTDKDLLK